MKTTRKNISDCSIETVAALGLHFEMAEEELVSRTLDFFGERLECSLKAFIRATQRSGWSRKAAFAAVDAAAACRSERILVENGALIRND
jgi:hypothetical protein